MSKRQYIRDSYELVTTCKEGYELHGGYCYLFNNYNIPEDNSVIVPFTLDLKEKVFFLTNAHNVDGVVITGLMICMVVAFMWLCCLDSAVTDFRNKFKNIDRELAARKEAKV